MSIKDALSPFQKRLKTEALIRSSILAGVIAAGVAILLGIVHVIVPWLIREIWIVLAFFGVFAISFGLVFRLLYRPTKRDVARRLDSLGMSERVETMLEYENDPSAACQLQRQDAIRHLQGIHPQDIRLRISKPLTVICAACVICATVLLFIPEVNAFSRHPIVNELHEMVDDSHLSDEFREELEQIVEDLEEKLEQSENDGDKEQAIEDAMEQIDESTDRENSRQELGEALQDQKDLQELGQAIQSGDKEGVSSALDKLREEMSQEPGKQESVAEQLQDALENSGVDSENDLYEALENMKDGLTDPDQPMEDTLDKAEDQIHDAMDKQQNAEELGEQMKQELENAKPSDIDGEESGGQSGGDSEGDQDSGERPGEGEQPGGSPGGSGNGSMDTPSGSGSEGPGGNTSIDANMKDQIVDPSAGQVNFGSVYAGYVADFLEKAEAGELPADVVQAMNQYLEQLKDQNEQEE